MIGSKIICEVSEIISAFGFFKTSETSLKVKETPMPNIISTKTDATKISIVFIVSRFCS